MGIAIPIETSARHMHLSQKDFEVLFGKGASLTFKSELSQPGQFVCEERVAVKGPRGIFENVAVLGPFRSETPGCTLIGPEGTLEIDHGVIVAKRHIHMTPVQAIQMNVHDNDEVFVIMESYERSLIFADVVVRVHPNFALAMHVDTDEANAFANENHPTGVILKLFGGRTYNLQKWAEELQNGIHRL